MENIKTPNKQIELISTTIHQLLERNATLWPEREAAIFCDDNYRLTWEQLKHEVDHAAKAFLAAGIKKGDKIAIWGTNIPEWLITQYASAKIGAALVTINPEWKESELEYALNQSDTNLLVMMPGFEKQSGKKSFRYDYTAILHALCPDLSLQKDEKHLTLEKLPELRQIFVLSEEKLPGMIHWNTALDEAEYIPDSELENMSTQVKPEDPAMVQYTSGTTGFPKGVILNQYSIINNALIITDNMNLTEMDRLCGPVPFYHCFGSILFSLGCLVRGATVIVPSDTFDPVKTLKAIEKERATGVYGVPTMFITELEDPNFNNYDLSSLRTGIMAGAPVDKELFDAVTEEMGAKEMTIAYGLTEASPVTHQTLIDDPLDKRMKTVGRPIHHTESKIVDPESFKPLGINQTGEIWVKGFQVMEGYYKKPEETSETIVEDGWLRTGDLGVEDEDGYFRIVGRLKEMLIVGGHNVYPAEVEQALHTLLDDEVEMLQVVGIPHPKLQEVVALIVTCKTGKSITLEEIRKRCQGKLEWPKIPRYLKIVDDFSMAMTVTGKIQKLKLREWLMKEVLL